MVRALIVSLLAAAALAAQTRDLAYRSDSERRLALVVGNNNYAYAPPLRNAANDALDLTAALEGLGFDVNQVIDADLRTLDQAIDRFVGSLNPGDVALFHFSGHGMEVDGENYLIPVDFKLKDEASVRYDAYSASKLHDRMAGAASRLNIVMLDACRNNGFRSTRSNGGGLAMMSAAEGSFIAFATGPGMTADDNREGRNGLFTAHLLEVLEEPGLTLDEVFNRVRQDVYSDSEKRQLPWTSSSVIGDFYFRWQTPEPAAEAPSAPAEAEPVAPAAPAMEVELTYWNSIQNSANPAVFQSYLERFPDGHFSELASIKLAELTVDPSPAPPWTLPEPAVEIPAEQQQPAPRVEQQPAPQSTPGPATTILPAAAPDTMPAEVPAALDLPTVTGDRGTPTRIARNDAELAALIASDPRTIEAVAIPVGAGYVRIGSRGAQVLLRKADASKQRYTLTLQEPDRRGAGPNPSGRAPSLNPEATISLLDGGAEQVEKKNLQTLEPIQYNVQTPEVCDELVIYRVEPGQVVGYVAEGRL